MDLFTSSSSSAPLPRPTPSKPTTFPHRTSPLAKASKLFFDVSNPSPISLFFFLLLFYKLTPRPRSRRDFSSSSSSVHPGRLSLPRPSTQTLHFPLSFIPEGSQHHPLLRRPPNRGCTSESESGRGRREEFIGWSGGERAQRWGGAGYG